MSLDCAALVQKLDLGAFIATFAPYFSRNEPFFLEGDAGILKNLLDELDSLQFAPPPPLKSLKTELIHIKKFGILSLLEIFEFVKILRYFAYLKSLDTRELRRLGAWFEAIIIPQELSKIAQSFDENGALLSGIYPQLDALNAQVAYKKGEVKKQLSRLLAKESLGGFFVDKQVHFVDFKECFLLKAGFERVLGGKILERSSAGYFYVFPSAINGLYDEIERLQSAVQSQIYAIEKEISALFLRHHAFLRFINAEFDRFDFLQARILFARAQNLSFILPNHRDRALILRDFCHPALKNPVPTNLDFSRKILLITGVNAGGKTMLLKSILAAAFLARFLIPFKINPHTSKIPHFRAIEGIINDPQNASADISTFAGRMIDFARLLGRDDFLLGVDEIELGTDSNEASALSAAILEHLQHKNIKIVITTHHKQLASMLANNANTELVAALYDEKLRLPRYAFLQGCIGKSYALETALRYGIAPSIVARAREIYGDNLENLSDLIEKTSLLNSELQQKNRDLDDLAAKTARKNEELDAAMEAQNERFKKRLNELESAYGAALREIKELAKEKNQREIHRFANRQNAILGGFRAAQRDSRDSAQDSRGAESSGFAGFKVGDVVQSAKNRGVIESLNGKSAIVALENGIRLKTATASLKHAPNIAKPPAKIALAKPNTACGVSLDLHGKRAEEALELLDKYISDCLVAGFEEVVVYHGIGGGVLSRVVREFLSAHPKIKGFADAPSEMGGFGAKIVRF